MSRRTCTGVAAVWLAVFGVTASGLVAQDAHYATYQYGPRANLLGGAVIGSAVDVSATYYNPGALARLDSIALIATSQTFELSNLLFRPKDAPRSVNLNDLSFGEAPGFVGGTLPFAFLGEGVLAYSVLTRHRFKTNVGETRVGELDLGELEGDALLKVRFNRDLSEQWFGLTYAASTRQVGLGISQYVAYRSQKGGNLLLGEAFPGRGGGALSLEDREFSYWSTRLLWKLGASFDWAGFSLGMTVTTPSIDLFGSGRLEVNTTVLGQDPDADSIPDPVFVANAQDGLSPTYKSPWSLGVGGTFRGAGTDFYVSAEYVGKVGEYTVLDGEDATGQTTGDTLDLSLATASDDVVNVNLGIERAFSDRFTGFAAFWTDFSTRPEDRELDLSVAGWDILFVSAGAAFRVGTSDFTLGLAYGWGSQAEVDLRLGDTPDEIISVIPRSVDLVYRSLRLLVALSI